MLSFESTIFIHACGHKTTSGPAKGLGEGAGPPSPPPLHFFENYKELLRKDVFIPPPTPHSQSLIVRPPHLPPPPPPLTHTHTQFQSSSVLACIKQSTISNVDLHSQGPPRIFQQQGTWGRVAVVTDSSAQATEGDGGHVYFEDVRYSE